MILHYAKYIDEEQSGDFLTYEYREEEIMINELMRAERGWHKKSIPSEIQHILQFPFSEKGDQTWAKHWLNTSNLEDKIFLDKEKAAFNAWYNAEKKEMI